MQTQPFDECFKRITDTGLRCPRCSGPIYHGRGKADPEQYYRQVFACQCLACDARRFNKFNPLKLSRWELFIQHRKAGSSLPGIRLPGADFEPHDHARMQRTGIYDPSIGAAKSRVGCWEEASRIAQESLEELLGLQSEYEDWLSNLPENFADTPTAEKLQAVCDLDIEGALDVIEEARDTELPQGFGKD